MRHDGGGIILHIVTTLQKCLYFSSSQNNSQYFWVIRSQIDQAENDEINLNILRQGQPNLSMHNTQSQHPM